MIIGSGDIAKVLTDNPDRIFFASGVSNSQETRKSEFVREKDLLFEQLEKEAHINPDGSWKKIVYFSSLSVFYKDSEYTKHKKRMEAYVKMFPRWTIVRLGNITWGTNPHTIINHFKAQVARGERLVIQDTFRYVIDKDEFLHWVNLTPEWNCEMNITGRRMTIKQIVDEFVMGA